MTAIDGNNLVYCNVANPGSTQIKTGAGVLHTLAINAPAAAGSITITDGVIGVPGPVRMGLVGLPAGQQPVTLIYDVAFKQGLVLQFSPAGLDLSASFR
jgi:hypothetical protein